MYLLFDSETEAFKSHLDRELLVTALEAVGIRADEETMSKVECWLNLILFVYQTRKNGFDLGRSKPSKELKNLDKALREWINYDRWRWEASLLARGSSSPTPSAAAAAVESFSTSISDVILLFESVRKPTRQEDLETDLARDLYWGYTELSGQKGLSDDGPAIRFIKSFFSILNVAVPEDFRRRLEQSIARNKSRVPIEIEGMKWLDPIEVLRGRVIKPVTWKNIIEKPEGIFHLEK
jgi:hypothetical protein